MRIQFLLLMCLLGHCASELDAGKASGGPARTGARASNIQLRDFRLPLSFEPNQGQTASAVKFLARGPGYTVFLTSEEAVLALRLSRGAQVGKPDVVRFKLLGATANPLVSGEQELAGRSNYFVGNDPRRWQRRIPTYAQVRYRNVYHGIDLVYHGWDGQLEYDFVVSPGVDARGIRLGIEGAGRMRVDRAGDLVLAVGEGEVRFHRPAAYQWKGGVRQPVEARYTALGKSGVGFKVGDYDHTQQLIIDPVLSYSTYLGGTGGDVAYALAVDASGNAYVAGTTGSSDFPLTSAVQTTNYGLGDSFVAKLDSTGAGLLYSTFIGGGGEDDAKSIAIDPAGNAYIAGGTFSDNFPITSGAIQSAYAGDGDGFIVKLSADGSSLVYASYLGGSEADGARAVAVDSSGNAYLTGSTASTDFPVVNPLQIGNIGAYDLFIAKVSPSGTNLIYSTYLGGSGADLGEAVAVDVSGNVFIGGYTLSTDFPTQSAFQSSNRGAADGFVTEVNAAGTSLIYSTYVGGSKLDRVFGMALDSVGSVYITGDTFSDDFPTTPNAFQINNHGAGDLFVSKLSPGAFGLVYSTLLGGGDTDQATALAIDSAGDTFVTGFTQSPDFPTLNPLQKTIGIFGASSCGGSLCTDAVAFKLNPSGALVYSTFLGGSGTETGWAVAADFSGAAIVAGRTTSGNFPAIAGGVQGQFLGSGTASNAFVARISDISQPGVALSPQQINFGNQPLNETSDLQTVTLINAGSATLNIAQISASGEFSQTNNCGGAVPPGGGACKIGITFKPTTPGTRTDQVTLKDNAQGSPHQITVTGTGVSSSAGALTLTPISLHFPSITVEEQSPVQTVQVMNTGQSAVTLSEISITGDFEESNTCGSLPSLLNVGDGCTVSISFTPTVSGARTGALSVTSNATGGARSVSLAGNGNPVFALSISSRSTVIQIGKAFEAKPSFTVTASAPETLIDSISLSCGSSTVTCTFDPASIKAGESSTLTMTGLTATSSNPLNIAVTGTYGSQTATVALTILFSDYEIAASPDLRTVNAGQSTSYTITVSPINAFEGTVLLGCGSLPQETECSWSPSAVYLTGREATATLTVKTTSQETAAGLNLDPPAAPLPGFAFHSAWFMLALAFIASNAVGARRSLPRLQTNLRAAVLALLLIITTLGFGCGSDYSTISITPAPNGTPSGNFVIGITGTLGNNGSVSRSTTVNLSVGAG